MPPPESPALQLPSNPSLALLRNFAKQLRKGHKGGDPSAERRIRDYHPAGPGALGRFSLRDAQLVVAREYGFADWSALKQYILAPAEDGVAALLTAANNGRLDRIAAILDVRPELLDARGGEGMRTALHQAAMNGQGAAVALLLERGADPNIRCQGDRATPLHFAAERGDIEVVERLVAHGADVVGADDMHGVGVLGWACVFHEGVRREVVDLLLARGARHNIFSAVSCGDLAAVRALAAEDPAVVDAPMAEWEDRRRPLHQALLKGQVAAALALVDLGADLAAADARGLAPLDWAALRGETAVVDALLAGGAPVALPAALALGRGADIDRLLAAEPGVLRPGGRWGHLLALAGRAGSARFVAALLERGADINAPHEQEGITGVTPLHEAAYRHVPDLAVIRLLVARGADLSALDGKYGGTPEAWARHRGNAEVVELLRAAAQNTLTAGA